MNSQKRTKIRVNYNNATLNLYRYPIFVKKGIPLFAKVLENYEDDFEEYLALEPKVKYSKIYRKTIFLTFLFDFSFLEKTKQLYLPVRKDTEQLIYKD